MPIATGAKSALAYKEETTYGTQPTGNWENMSFNSESIETNINTIQTNEVKADRTVGSIRGGNIQVGGDIVTDLYVQKLGFFWRQLLAGTYATTTVTPTALAVSTAYTRGQYVTSNSKIYVALTDGTTPASISGGIVTTAAKQKVTAFNVDWQHVQDSGTLYQHVMTGGVSFPTGGLSVERKVGGGTADVFMTYNGGRINTLNLAVPQEGIVGATWGMLFKNANPSALVTSAGTPTFTGDEPVAGYDVWVKLNSVVSTVVSNVNLTVNNNFDTNVFTLGSRYRKDTPTGRREISGNMTIMFETRAEYDYFLGETEIPMEIGWITNGFYGLIELPEIKFTGGQPTPKIAGNGTVSAQFNFNAYKQDSAFDIRYTMRNATASY